MPAIVLESLSKSYGRARGIIDLDLEVEEGEVFGFLGPNGAGKTTTIRLLLDLIRPSSGKASVLGLDSTVESMQIRRRVGYLPGELALWEWMTSKQLLRHLAHIRGGVDWDHVESMFDRLQVEPNRKIEDLSTGNKQKVGIIQAFMHRPELIVLDEPTNGLDPLMQQVVYRMVEEAHRDGRTVFLSSHVLPEVERIAQRVGIIRKGRLIEVATVDELKGRAVRQVEIRFGNTIPGSGMLSAVVGVTEATVASNVAHVRVEGSMDPLVKAISDFEVVSIRSHDRPLEEVFLDLYRGDDDV